MKQVVSLAEKLIYIVYLELVQMDLKIKKRPNHSSKGSLLFWSEVEKKKERNQSGKIFLIIVLLWKPDKFLPPICIFCSVA